MRVCTLCRQALPATLEFFHKGGGRMLPGGLSSRCKDCMKRRATESRDLKVYGLRPGDYERILAMQGGTCRACGARPNERRRLHVDHCHETGRVRGLLCLACNTALGHLGESVKRLSQLATYLFDTRNIDLRVMTSE